MFLFFRYSFAIVGINLTHMAYRLLVDGSAKTHMFNVCASSHVENERRPILKHFHHLYSYLFVEFDKFWLSEKPKDVMEFNRIRDLFENQMRTFLEDRSAHFKINIAVDNVWRKEYFHRHSVQFLPDNSFDFLLLNIYMTFTYC